MVSSFKAFSALVLTVSLFACSWINRSTSSIELMLKSLQGFGERSAAQNAPYRERRLQGSEQAFCSSKSLGFGSIPAELDAKACDI